MAFYFDNFGFYKISGGGSSNPNKNIYVAQWDNVFTYSLDSVVAYDGNFYKSLNNNNINNLPTDTNFWQEISSGNTGISPYKQEFLSTDWILDGDGFYIMIPSSTHNQGNDKFVYAFISENNISGANTPLGYGDFIQYSNGDIKLLSDTAFDGYMLITSLGYNNTNVEVSAVVGIIPDRGHILPLNTSRAYYEKVLYSPVPIFNDTSSLRKYIIYYGNGTNNFVAYSDDGKIWDTETQVTNVANGYHCESILVGTTVHLFYWDIGVSIYSPAATRHCTIDITADCSVATSDAPLSGNYITGIYADGLRYGTYGIYTAFYNNTPTDNPSDPYSYRWCIMHDGTDGSNEGILFATSDDGYNFSAWNGNNEVLSRGIYPQWDSQVGACSVWKEGSNWFMYYSGGIGTTHGSDSNFADGIGLAMSTDGINWLKYDKNPIMFKTFSYKTAKRLYCPCVVKQDDGLTLYYTAKSYDSKYTVCMAIINKLI